MKRTLIALALAAALPLSAQASDVNYTYAGIGYASTDFVSENFDGYALEGSAAFNDKFYANGTYRRVRNGDFDISFAETVLNLGYRHAMNDKADFIAEVGYVNYKADLGSIASDSAGGYRVGAGFRGMLAPKFEAGIKGTYTDVKDSDGEFGVSIYGNFHINQTWGIVGSYDTTKVSNESFNTWGLGVRASF